LEKGEQYIEIGSLVSARTGDPLVELKVLPNGRAQISPAQAREFAVQLYEAAEAAQTDAFLMEFFTRDEGGPTRVQTYALVAAFREWREKRRGAEPPIGVCSTTAADGGAHGVQPEPPAEPPI
jgi:hypothetical protein